MALVGTYKKFTEVESKTETRTVTVKYPKDLPHDSPDFEKAGTEEQTEVPLMIEEVTEYPNSYVIIRSVALHQIVGSDSLKNVHMNIMYSIYQSKDDKTDNFFNPLLQGDIDSIPSNFDDESFYTKNIMSHAYELLKKELGFEELIND